MESNPIKLTANKISAPTSNQPFNIFSDGGFTLLQRMAKMYASGGMVPFAFRSTCEKYDPVTKKREVTDNPQALSNCAIAIEIAQRLNVPVIMVMQNLNIIDGRPSWSAQWIIACINTCGRFTQLQFEIEDLGEMEATYTEYTWSQNKKIPVESKVSIRNLKCIAYANIKETGERVESAPITIELAVNEGWYMKNGSKWRSMPEQMLRYRAASFFGRAYVPEFLMGIQSSEEVEEEVFNYVEVQDDEKVSTGKRASKRKVIVVNTEPEPAEQEPINKAVTENQVKSDFPPTANKGKTSTTNDDARLYLDPLTGEVLDENAIPDDFNNQPDKNTSLDLI